MKDGQYHYSTTGGEPLELPMVFNVCYSVSPVLLKFAFKNVIFSFSSMQRESVFMQARKVVFCFDFHMSKRKNGRMSI